jgi:hypothetical protein
MVGAYLVVAFIGGVVDRTWIVGIVVGLGLAATACGDAPTQEVANIVDAPAVPQGELRLMVTVDWEGRDLSDDNLEAMRSLRDRFDTVPLVQFLNAAYFTKPGADQADVSGRMNSVLRDHDEVGLHIHAWKRLFEASGVTFRNSPTFWGTSVPSYSCSHDCGHEVPISAYTTDELREVIRFSVDTLDGQGFGRPVSFRAGGWMAAQNVREALAAEGFDNDSSAVPALFLEGEIGHLPLHDWVEELWRGTDATSQPYALDGLTEIPDNGALADYVTGDEMYAVYLDAKRRLEENPDENVLVNIGFHQETAAEYLPRIEDALERILADVEQSDVPLRLTTMSPTEG